MVLPQPLDEMHALEPRAAGRKLEQCIPVCMYAYAHACVPVCHVCAYVDELIYNSDEWLLFGSAQLLLC